MKNLTFLFTALFFGSIVMGQETRKIFGTVSDGTNPIENVTVSILKKKFSATTDAVGKYEIEAVIGDQVRFSYTGMRTITIRIEDVTRVLNPIMIPDITELDEVEVAASKRRSQKDMEEDYTTNKNIIRTAWGYLDAERAAGNIRILTEEEINPVSLCILDLLKNGNFSSIKVFGSCADVSQPGQVFIRLGSNVPLPHHPPAVYDVDGQIFEEAPRWIDINNIKRIGILSNLATTASYGTLGKGGVIVINTIGGNPKNNGFVDRARLRNNYTDGLELSREEVAKNAPTYLRELRSSGSFEESKTIFEEYHKTYSNSPYFLLDAYTHFVEDYNEVAYADGIIEKHFGRYANNPVLFKALAYTYEAQGRYEKANRAYKDVFIIRPNYVQSYMNMASSYRNLNKAKQAASMYARYHYLIEEGFLEQDLVGFGPIMDREFNNLLSLEKNTVLEGKKAKKLHVTNKGFEGTRLVFEWNDGEAEFELQFVNPENQYHKWKHSMADNEPEIVREKDYGYSVKEYLVDGSLPGTWKVNINYLGNKSLTPTYLKATIYYDYGSRTQRKEAMVFKLDLKNVNQELFSFTTSGKIVVR